MKTEKAKPGPFQTGSDGSSPSYKKSLPEDFLPTHTLSAKLEDDSHPDEHTLEGAEGLADSFDDLQEAMSGPISGALSLGIDEDDISKVSMSSLTTLAQTVSPMGLTKGMRAMPTSPTFSSSASTPSVGIPVGDTITIEGVVYNSRGYEVCGQLNQHSKPCQRIGRCPFHGPKKKKLAPGELPSKSPPLPQPTLLSIPTPTPTPIPPPPTTPTTPITRFPTPPQVGRVVTPISTQKKRPPPFKKAPYKQGWTKEEHIRFLSGLQIHGKGAWKEIAQIVGSRTPTQIQSHAQKYYLRQKQEVKNKRSIHDISLEDLEMDPALRAMAIAQAKPPGQILTPSMSGAPRSPTASPTYSAFPSSGVVVPTSSAQFQPPPNLPTSTEQQLGMIFHNSLAAATLPATTTTSISPASLSSYPPWLVTTASTPGLTSSPQKINSIMMNLGQETSFSSSISLSIGSAEHTPGTSDLLSLGSGDPSDGAPESDEMSSSKRQLSELFTVPPGKHLKTEPPDPEDQTEAYFS